MATNSERMQTMPFSSVYGEYVVGFILSDGVCFLPCDHGLFFLHKLIYIPDLVCDNSINQIKHQSNQLQISIIILSTVSLRVRRSVTVKNTQLCTQNVLFCFLHGVPAWRLT